MDHVNKTLLLSLKQDLLTLNESIENINTENELQSWLFPTKEYKFVKQFIDEHNIWGISNVRLVLELIIDRLYIGIRLILQIIEKHIKDDNCETNYYVRKPQQMTVGCCFEQLKKVVEIVLNKMTDKKAATDSDKTSVEITMANKIKKHCKTQTDTMTMATCDSCASAIMSMKFLLNIFDVAKDDIYQVKRVQSTSLHDLTQFGCMLHTTTCIEKSLKQLIEKLMTAEDKNKELNEKVISLTSQLQNKGGCVILLEQENNSLNETLKKTGVQLAILRNKVSDLELIKQKNEEKINNLNIEKENLNYTVTTYREVNIRLKEDKNLLGQNFEKSRALVTFCLQRLPKMEENVSVIEQEQQYVLQQFDALHTALDNLIMKLKKITKYNTGMENKLQLLNSDFTENSENLNKNLQEFQAKVREKLNMNSNDVNISQTAKIKGDPIEDFSRQIEENKEKIKKLLNENEKLESILTKFKSIKK